MQPIYMKIPVVPAHHRQPEPAQPESTAPEPTSPEFSYTHSYISAAAEGRDSLIQVARKVTSLDPSVHDKIARENREHAELGLLKDMQTARANTSAFAQNIAAGGKGSDAKNAPYAMAAFQLEQMKTLREKYKDSPAGLRYMENHLGSLAHSSVSDMADYSLKEHQTYKEQIYQGELDAARAILTNWETPETVRWATLRDLGGKTKAFFSGPDRDAAIDRLEGFLRSAWNEMWLGRLNSLRESDPEAALKLTRDALASGLAMDDIALPNEDEPAADAFSEAILALKALGYSPQEAISALKGVRDQADTADELIKLALRHMAQQG